MFGPSVKVSVRVNTGGKAMKLLTKGKFAKWRGSRGKGKTERIRRQSLERQRDCCYREELANEVFILCIKTFLL